jgi:heptosyltransferase III
LRKIKKIVIIIQRSNGDVFLSSSLIKALYDHYESPQIDLLVNDDTIPIAKTIPYIKNIHIFSYQKKHDNRWRQEIDIVFNIIKKYDLSINLTASDRSVIYSLIAAKKSISAIENDPFKSWWKKLLLNHYYYFDKSKHILLNNLKSLDFLNITFENINYPFDPSNEAKLNVKKKLESKLINDFLIFHPSAQYEYKIYPRHLRDILLASLNTLGVSILVTGGTSPIDQAIKRQIPKLKNVFNFIGETSIEEFVALSKLSLGYIGMDTLNMHIAASQSKQIFAIFGPTNLKMWSPWSNVMSISATQNFPKQRYSNITIFQADMECVACGKEGCEGNGKSICLDHINPKMVSIEVQKWLDEEIS